jgi:hypothetical protein
MPKLKGLQDPNDALRDEAYKRRITAKRNDEVVQLIERFRDQQKTSPKKPSEGKKLVSEIADYVSSLNEFREETAKLKTEIKVPPMPTIKKPRTNVTPDVLDIYLVTVAAALTAVTPFLKKLGIVKR